MCADRHGGYWQKSNRRCFEMRWKITRKFKMIKNELKRNERIISWNGVNIFESFG